MKRFMNLTLTVSLVFFVSLMITQSASAQQKPTTPAKGQYFVDRDGDGVCDNVGTHQGQMKGSGKGKGHGPKDGTGNQGQGPKNGTGYGAGSGNCNGTGSCGQYGSGTCDGTGPKGNAARNGKK